MLSKMALIKTDCFFGVLKQQARLVVPLSLRHESGLWRV